MVNPRSGDRGQLLLISGLAIAVVVIGTVLFMNSVQFADSVGTQGNSEDLRDAERTAEMVRADVAKVGDEVADEAGLLNFGDAIEENVTAYNRYASGHRYSHSNVHVDVQPNMSASNGSGRYVYQNETEAYDDGTGDKNWDVARNVTRVGVFNFTITERGQTDAQSPFAPDYEQGFNVTVSGEDAEWTLQFDDLENPGLGTDQDLRLYVIQDGSKSEIADIDSEVNSSYPLRINLRNGSYREPGDGPGEWEEGAFTFADNVSKPFDISFAHRGPGVGSRTAEGEFHLVTDSEYEPADDPTRLEADPILANVNLDLRIVQPGIEYETSLWVNETRERSP